MSRIAAWWGPGASGRARGLADAVGRRGSPLAAAERIGPPAALVARGPGGGIADRHGLMVALDGRIFNRDELGERGGDADAIAALWRRLGPAETLRRINGDLAVVVFEPETETLWLARDRFGLRPLYRAQIGPSAAACSRPRALAAAAGDARPDPAYLATVAGSHYRLIDNDPEGSPYAAVDQVPAASLVTIRHGVARTERYWWPGPADVDPAPEALAERYRELLADAVRRRLAVAPDPAFTLSGGMDSSSVLASAARDAGPQTAYSTVYEDPTYDERAEIADMLDGPVGEWHPVEVGDVDALGTVERLLRDHDEPIATATWLSHAILASRAAGDGVRSLVGGLGGDELNAGEFEYFPFHFADLAAAGRDDELVREIAGWARHHDHPVFRKDPGVARDMMARLTDPARPGLCRPDVARMLRYADALDPELARHLPVRPIMEHPFDTCLANRTWQDLTRETLPCCLRAEDRTLAALGMERFHPFLDHRLVELAYAVPGDLKIRDGVTKRLLREAMRGVLPEATRTRVAKTGWNAPAHRWFSGRGLEVVRDLVASRGFRERGVYDVAEVERLIGEHERILASGAPAENHMMFLWQLVNVELWLASPAGAPVAA